MITEYKKVDREKLDKQLQRRGSTMSKTSVALGYETSHISASMRKHGGLPVPIITGLKMLWGIEYDDIKPDEKPTAISAFAAPQRAEDLKQLELDVRALRQEHYAINQDMQKILKAVETLAEQVDKAYTNTVYTRESANRSWQGITAIGEKLETYDKTKNTIVDTSCRVKDILNRVKNMPK